MGDAAAAAAAEQGSQDSQLVSFIMPARNAAEWLDECLQSVLGARATAHRVPAARSGARGGSGSCGSGAASRSACLEAERESGGRAGADQTYRGPMELCVFDDGSTDDTHARLLGWAPRLRARGVALHVAGSGRGAPARGCGFGRNRAVELSSGAWLCFLDADDVMAPRRVEAQLAAAREAPPRTLVGSRYWRDGGERPRDMAWHNGMSQAQLTLQRLRETTIAQPTWFCARAVYDAVGGYVQNCPHEAEDMRFFYAHLAAGGGLLRVDEPLLMYRAAPEGATGTRSIPKELIWSLRLEALEAVLREPPWAAGFTIWNAGKEGRRLFRALSPAARRAVRAFCDVDARKVAAGWWQDTMTLGRDAPRVPIVHYAAARPPLLCCVKGGLTGDGPDSFESRLAALQLTEGRDYLHFS